MPAMTLSDYLAKHEMTQRDLARKAGVSEPHLSDIMRGKKRCGADIARKLSQATGGKVKLETLLFPDAAA